MLFGIGDFPLPPSLRTPEGYLCYLMAPLERNCISPSSFFVIFTFLVYGLLAHFLWSALTCTSSIFGSFSK